MLGGGSWTSDLERCQDAAHAPEKLRLPKIESIWINLDQSGLYVSQTLHTTITLYQ